MRYVEIDIDSCNHAIEVAKHRLQASDAPKYIKRLGAAIKPVLLISNRKSPWLAEAWAVSEKCRDHDRLKNKIVASRYKTLTIEHRRYFFIIRVYPKSFNKRKKTKRSYLNKVIGHEMGHILQIYLYKQINGNWSTSDPKSDHSKEWARLSKFCGGNTDEDGGISL